MTQLRQLQMRYAGGGIVRHLGLQNYRGPVPALSELIANAWDADATEVKVTVPFGKPFHSGDEISLKDNGHGMNWIDCDEKYLVIGRNRREVEQTDRTQGGRPLMAHKGLGKLAGFGIAKEMEVRTISDGKLTAFLMSFEKLDELKQGETYEPTMIFDEEPVELPNGTAVILKKLLLQRAISEDRFKKSMAKRFSIFSDKFRVYMNGKRLKKTELPLEFKFPESGDSDITVIDKEGFGSTTLSNNLQIRWWIGFTPDTIKIKEFHGVSVLARGRVAQDPWDFNLAGGTWGQHGLRYLTGEIISEFVDEGISYESDTILTNRAGLNWENPLNRPLYDWARKKIGQLLRLWSRRRGAKTLKRVKKKYPELVAKIERFPKREQRELNLAMRSFAQVPTMKPERLVKTFNYVIDGYQDKAFVDLINEMTVLPLEERVKIIEILQEFDVSEAIRVYKIVASRVKVIRKFREMIEAGVREKPDMHEHIRKYPWLLGIRYQAMDYEHTLQRILEERFGFKPDDKGGKKVPDFVCIRGGNQVVVIELKRPKDNIGREELAQISGYVDYLRNWADRGNSEKFLGKKISRKDIDGCIIAYDIKQDPIVEEEVARLEDYGIHVFKWYALLEITEQDHKVYLDIVKNRAPKDDPRIIELEEKLIP